ncbi:MAG: MFS transporter [Streptosporangiaceae bacterium]
MGGSGRGERLIVPLLAFLGVMAYALPMAVVSPALPIIGGELGVSPAEAAWALTGMTLSASVATPVVGRLGDLYGPRRVLLVVLPVGVLGQMISALAVSMPMLLGGRVLAGLGSGVFPLAYTIIRVSYPPDRTASGIGLMSSMLALGGALSWVIAGPVIDHLGWRWLIWVPAVALVPGTLAAWWIVPRTQPEPGAGVDWWGAVLFAAWMTAGLTALTQGVPWGWTSPGTLGLAATALVLALLWLLLESRIRDPLVDLTLMRVRGVWTANLGSLFAGYALMAAGLLFPLLIQLPASTGFGFGGTATDTAFLALPASVAMTLAGLSAGRLDRSMGSRMVLLTGGGLVAAGYGFTVVAHHQLWQLVVANVLRGIGLGFAYAAVATLVVAAVPIGRTGVATGVNTLVRTVGAGLGTQVSAVLVASFGGAERGFTVAFAVCAVLGVGLLAVALVSPREKIDERNPPLVLAETPP